VRAKPEQVLEENQVAAHRLLSSTSRPTYFSFSFINIAANHKSDADNVSRRVDSKGHRRSHFHFNIFFVLPAKPELNVVNLFDLNDLIFVVGHHKNR
jgi:hypothetical protein